MSLSPFQAPMSHIFYGIQLGTIDSLVLVLLITITTAIPDQDGRLFCRGILFFVFLCFQLAVGGVSVEQGREFWNPVLEVGYVVLGVMIGALAVYKVYGEVVQRIEEGKKGKEKARQ
ncbi:hypothetical protein M409DRAFT_23633 [Zasmidium cellare ATCC 36951]|uniref:Uncharacterized protein n=1 Tax=Zasmidium cellare ATCC 36951 TaxID=1080233 RepID=A0A6A6CFQ8_ZASCE|nr:uncharacterized protein M409DRAFT_23633 [Zasmidium cellare ATCC 36951]KAF2165901.1 hypothetical protein M409DRAFT_23633 [Zasmidium cellare ATCC 36951]